MFAGVRLMFRRFEHPNSMSNIKVHDLTFLLFFGLVCAGAVAQESSPSQKIDFAGVNTRGDLGMGFSHEKPTHHFHLLADGGAIEIQSNEPADSATQDAIRRHLAMIASRFSQGDFSIPMFISCYHAAGCGDDAAKEKQNNI